MRLGPKAMEALRAEISGSLREGDVLVVAGAVALEGTRLLVEHEKELLQTKFSAGFLRDAEESAQIFGMETQILDGIKGVHAFCESGTGGILCTLWKMSEAFHTGLRADLRKIPIRQETIEICECFDLDPYRLLSGGSVLIGTDRGGEIVRFCLKRGIPAAVIGTLSEGNDRILYSREIARYLDRPGQDEITKLSWGAPWYTAGIFPGQERKDMK